MSAQRARGELARARAERRAQARGAAAGGSPAPPHVSAGREHGEHERGGGALQEACAAGDAQDRERGRGAARPREIPPRGWRDIAWRVWDQLGQDNVAVLAGGVAFYAFFALIPALAVLVSIYGLVSDPAAVQEQIAALSTALPLEARQLIERELNRIVTTSEGSLSVAAVIGLLLTLWSAGAGVRGLIAALNTVYGEVETRGYLHLGALSLLFTAGGAFAVLFMVGTVAVLPPLLDGLNLGLGGPTRRAIELLRWPVVIVFLLLGLGIVYRFGPRRRQARWRWVTWGAALATALWLLASLGLSAYVRYFGSFNKTYGSLGAVAIILMWCYLSSYAVLLGAEVNAEMEHQTRCDSTVGEPKPMGKRGAYVADHVGPVP